MVDLIWTPCLWKWGEEWAGCYRGLLWEEGKCVWCGVWWVACGMKKGTGRLGYEELGSRGAHEGLFVRDEVRLVN